jgi:hypothetical protein
VGPSSNHSNHAILMECHNIIMVVYQIVLEKWWIDFANDNDWSNFVTIQLKSPLELFYPKAMCHHKWCNTHNVQQLIIFSFSKLHVFNFKTIDINQGCQIGHDMAILCHVSVRLDVTTKMRCSSLA